MNYAAYATQYRQLLLERIVPFWLNHSLDTVLGGYQNVLSARGEVVCTDKWMAWHGQQVAAFAQLNHYEARPEFLDYAQHGADFMLHYGSDAKENWWAVLDNTGRGVTAATDTYTEAAAATGWAMLWQTLQQDSYAEAAKKTLLKALKRREKLMQKAIEDVVSGRKLKSLGELSALAQALTASEAILGEKLFRQKAEDLLYEFSKHFWESRAGIMLEYVSVEGYYSDCLWGRRIHAGRVFEAFNAFCPLMHKLNKRRLRQQMAQHVQFLAESTWDEAYGGYFYWMDVKSRVATNPEAYFKYAWVHLEASSALLQAYQILQDRQLLRSWQRTHDYLWQHFPDNTPEGEWVGTLSRHGEPLYPVKADPEKNAWASIKNLITTISILQTI